MIPQPVIIGNATLYCGDWVALRPITLRMANDFVANHHRHNGRTSRNGGKFAIGAQWGLDRLIGVAIVGNPLSATLMDGYTAEVLRLCVVEHAPKNICSMLYAACWQAWKAMGGLKLITYTLLTESGASLRGAGWTISNHNISRPSSWNRPNRHRKDQSIYHCAKQRWEISALQKRKFIEIDPDYFKIACARIEKAQQQTRMEFDDPQ